MDRIAVENFDAPAYAVGSDVDAFVAAAGFGEIIHPGSPGSKNSYIVDRS